MLRAVIRLLSVCALFLAILGAALPRPADATSLDSSRWYVDGKGENATKVGHYHAYTNGLDQSDDLSAAKPRYAGSICQSRRVQASRV